MVCELASTCPKFNDPKSDPAEVMAIYRARYCKSRFEECARYRVFVVMGRDAVPDDMYPNDTLRARRIINEGRTRSRADVG